MPERSQGTQYFQFQFSPQLLLVDSKHQKVELLGCWQRRCNEDVKGRGYAPTYDDCWFFWLLEHCSIYTLARGINVFIYFQRALLPNCLWAYIITFFLGTSPALFLRELHALRMLREVPRVARTEGVVSRKGKEKNKELLSEETTHSHLFLILPFLNAFP